MVDEKSGKHSQFPWKLASIYSPFAYCLITDEYEVRATRGVSRLSRRFDETELGENRLSSKGFLAPCSSLRLFVYWPTMGQFDRRVTGIRTINFPSIRENPQISRLW